MDETEEENMLAAVQGRQIVYEFLARLFLHSIPTPGRDYAQTFLQAIDGHACWSDLDDFRNGMRSLKAYKATAADGDLEELQRQPAVDRTRLCRGATGSGAIAPPYEAPYLVPEQEADRLLAIVRFYRKADLTMSDGQRERMDFIGIELAFMAELCAGERAALAAGDADKYKTVLSLEREFLQGHLLAWAVDYCGQMIEHAQTDFFRGFGYLMRAFPEEGAELCDQT